MRCLWRDNARHCSEGRRQGAEGQQKAVVRSSYDAVFQLQFSHVYLCPELSRWTPANAGNITVAQVLSQSVHEPALTSCLACFKQHVMIIESSPQHRLYYCCHVNGHKRAQTTSDIVWAFSFISC